MNIHQNARLTFARRDRVRGAGWECLFVAVDDHARIGFTQIKPDECGDNACAFLHAAVAYFAKLGVTIQRVLTDNGSVYRSRCFASACHRLGLQHSFTRPYRPQTQRQGRALHSVRFARAGLWHSLSTFCRTHRDQSASPPSGHRRYRAND